MTNWLITSDGRLRAIWQFVVSVFVFVLTTELAAHIAASIAPFRSIAFEAVYRPLHLMLLIICFGAMLALFERRRQYLVAAQGLNPQGPWLRDLIQGALLGGGLITVAALALWPNMHLLSDTALNGQSIPQIFAVLWILLTAAMLEEVAFRGYPFQMLVESLSFIDRNFSLPKGTTAAVALSLAFAAMHQRNPHATWISSLNTALAGLLLSMAYLRTQALWLPIGFHFAWNTVQGLFWGFPVSGVTIFAVLIKTQITGPGWLTGGEYGPEGGISVTAVLISGFAILHFVTKGHPLYREVEPPAPRI